MEYKIGDRVRLIKAGSYDPHGVGWVSCMDELIGEVLVITDYCDRTNSYKLSHLDCERIEFWFAEEWLMPAELKPGDLVRVKDYNYCKSVYGNRFGASTRVFCGGTFVIKSVLNNKIDGMSWYKLNKIVDDCDLRKDVTMHQFLPCWLRLADENIDTTELDDFFKEWGDE